MPFYLYSVSNSQGQVLQGTLQAANTDAARDALSSAGYVVREIREQGAAAPIPVTANVPRIPMPHTAVAKAGTHSQISPAAFGNRPSNPEIASKILVNPLSGGGKKAPDVKTKRGRDRDLFFLFTQLGSYFRSGMNPVQSLTDLSTRSPERYRSSLHYAAQVVGEGGRMSDAFEMFPNLYPPDVVGTIRAGEVAGFLPEAMEEIADKMQASDRLKRRLRYFSYMFIATIAMAPLILGVVEGSLASIAAQDTAGGSLPVAGTLGKGVGLSFLHNLPITLLIFGAIWGFLAWFNSMKMRDFRHRIVMKTPVIGGRAMAESMSRFTWAMTMISRGGLSPQATFLLALQSVPNLAVRKRLEIQGNQMTESEKLSTALRRAEVLPPEYGDIVQTGEITGDVPRALESVRQATDNDYRAKDSTTVMRSSFYLYAILGVLILFIAAWLLVKYYGGLIHTILGE